MFKLPNNVNLKLTASAPAPARARAHPRGRIVHSCVSSSVNERRDMFEKSRSNDIKKIHDQLVTISKSEVDFAKKMIKEIVPEESIEKLRNIFVPARGVAKKVTVESVENFEGHVSSDYFKDM